MPHTGRPTFGADTHLYDVADRHVETRAATPANVALVVANPAALSTQDNWFKTHLQAAGQSVTVLDDNGLTVPAVSGKAAVVVSGSVVPATLGTLLNGVTVPVVVANTTVAANMGLTGAVSGTDYGTTTAQTQVALTPAGSAHPTGGGLTAGTVTTSSVAETIGWAKPSVGAVTAATLVSDSSKVTVFSYEPGTAMITGTAPARRVGFFVSNGTSNTTGNTAQLFDTAVSWEANTTPIVSYIGDASDRIVARKINADTRQASSRWLARSRGVRGTSMSVRLPFDRQVHKSVFANRPHWQINGWGKGVKGSGWTGRLPIWMSW